MTQTTMLKDFKDFDAQAFQQELANKIKNGQPLFGKEGIFTPLIKMFLETTLQGEMNAHLDDCKQEGAVNRRNGKARKTVKSDAGSFELDTPRDREGTFEPRLVKKRQTVLNASLDNKILALYAAGMSYQDISEHLSDMYGVEVSHGMISQISDQLLPVINEWRSRPLESVYPVLFLDAMFYKSREDGKVTTKVIYNILGLNQEGRKDLLGFYLAESEGAHFWLGVLNDLKARGVEDILIACVDGLKGFPEAIATTFPQTEVQLCIVHQIRHSLKYVASKDQKPFMKDLKKVYQASNKSIAEEALVELDLAWGSKYPMVIKSWQSKWESLSTYFKFAPDIRRMIYTTNAIESYHRQIRKYTKTKGAFTSENALLKLVYCAYQSAKKKWTMPLHNWSITMSQLDIYFPGRLKIELN